MRTYYEVRIDKANPTDRAVFMARPIVDLSFDRAAAVEIMHALALQLADLKCERVHQGWQAVSVDVREVPD